MKPLLPRDPSRLALVTLSLLALASSGRLLAGQVTLAWDPNTEPDLAGYRLHYGTSPGVYEHVVDVGNVTTRTLTGLLAGTTYAFVATAYNTAGLESAPSNEVSYAVPNAAPTIGPVAAQTVVEDAIMGPVAFTVGDVDNDPGTLVVTASSSNPALVPQARLVLGGSGANRTVKATPTANASGSTTITLTVSDGQRTATRSFTLTVTAVNDPPTISNLTDQTTIRGVPAGPIPFTVGDIETAAGSLAVSCASSNPSLVSATGLVLAGAGNTRTITVTPTPGQTGTATITVTVSDGSATAGDSFLLTVTGNVPPPWSAQDIGSPSLDGSTVFDGTTFTVIGSGTDIGGLADQFHFAWQPLSGDGEITARVIAFSGTNPSASAGVMIRETLNANSRHTLMSATPEQGFQLLYRSATAGLTSSTSGGALYAAPDNWVRLVREGSMVKAYKSGDGLTWTQVGPTLRAPPTTEIHVGLAVTSGDPLQRGTAWFDSVTVIP